MTREHTVAVKLKQGIGEVTHCAGHRYDIKVRAGEVVTQWGDGSPITWAEFDMILEPTGHFEVQSAVEAGGEKEEE